MPEENQVDSKEQKITYQPLNILNIIIALLIPVTVGYLSVVLITNVFTFISREIWSLQVVWPDVLFLGGFLGGLFGGIIAITEVALLHYKNYKVAPGEAIPSDLYYIGVLIVFTYVLEFLSENQAMQIILFFLEVSFFFVLGRNMSKLSLETRVNVKHKPIINNESKVTPESQIDKTETE